MGWTSFSVSNDEPVLDIIRREFEQTRLPGKQAGWGFEYLCMKGSTAYGIMWRDTAEEPVQRVYFGIVILTRTTTKKYGYAKVREFAYKDMGEDMEPYYYGAPKRMLDLLDKLAPNPGPGAVAWREKCREKLAAYKYARKPKAGERVEYGGMHYTFVEPAGPRRGWHVRTDGGVFYRMTAKQVGQVMEQERRKPEPKFSKEVDVEQFMRDHFQVIHIGAAA